MIRIGGIMQKSKYYEEIALPRFPDGTLHLTLRYIDVSLLSGIAKEILISWNYEGDEEMAAILFLTKHFQMLGYEVSLNMPYIPNARQDRVKKEEDVFTLKYFAEFINSLNFCKVYVLDPHSNVSMALIDNIVVESPESYCAKAIKKIYDDAKKAKNEIKTFKETNENGKLDKGEREEVFNIITSNVHRLTTLIAKFYSSLGGDISRGISLPK